MASSSRPYFFYMDTIRAFLMLLGVPYHAARLYGDGRRNAVQSPDTSHLLDVFADISQSFRMEAFFVVAGFFACMVLSRSDLTHFFRGRLTRIGMPLLFCTILFAPIGAALIASGRNNGAPVPPGTIMALLPLPGTWWVMHLWFLHTLLLLTFILIGLALLARQWPLARRAGQRVLQWLSALIRQPYLVAGLVIITAWIAVWIIPTVLKRAFGMGLNPLDPFFDLRPVIRFLPMFLFGAAMWLLPSLREWMSRPRRLALPAALVGSLIFVIGSNDARLEGILTPIGACFAGFFWAQFLIAGAATHFDRHSPVVRYLSNASFTVYLVHFPIVLGLGLFFLPIAWPPLIEFSLIVAITLAISLAIHEVIRRSRILSLLFNGKPLGSAA
ncbi:glucan biosynthesis protein [Polymorphobacter glacialis]|uniref:Glucan biosynthesis protein n=1 Tax=Sandarakinorhabdus glacialis TaxID=1614636 RepID=A0A916ZWH7_9SPHN|nr:acyltransferase family protein [Polymorphobacter glacialis]GGE16813.1 glucan biosynthesis protein [Polymorphobacter glacialis]